MTTSIGECVCNVCGSSDVEQCCAVYEEVRILCHNCGMISEFDGIEAMREAGAMLEFRHERELAIA